MYERAQAQQQADGGRRRRAADGDGDRADEEVVDAEVVDEQQ